MENSGSINPINVPIYKNFSPEDVVDDIKKLLPYHWDASKRDTLQLEKLSSSINWDEFSDHMINLTEQKLVPNGYYWMRDDGKVFYSDIDLTNDPALNENLLQQRVGFNKHNTQFFKFLNSELGPYFDAAYSLFGANDSNKLVRVIVQMPGQFIPTHIDTFVTYRNYFKVPQSVNVSRRLVFVTPWTWGHFLHYGTKIIPNWLPGECMKIEQGVPHSSANAGYTPKVTMQLDCVAP